MNNFRAKEIKNAGMYLQEKLDIFKSQEEIKKVVLQDRESILTKMINSLFKKGSK